MVPKETTPRGQTPRQTSTIYRPAQRSRSKSPSGNKGKDTEKKKQKSGRRSKSPGHANGRCKSESRRPSSRAESNVSIATTRTDQDADNKSNKKQKRREERETRTLCKTVQTKLEHFINFEQRETSFGAISNQTTTKRMLYYDVQYKLKEAEKERKEARKKKKEKKEKNNDDKKINPRRHEGSIQMVSQSKVNKLSASANQIMESVPVSRLNTIHRYRLHSPATPNTPENGKVQNYCSHVGAALHSDNYVQYYVQQGLHSGKSEDERDGDGSEEKKDDDTESKCSSGKRDTKKRGKETKKKGDGKKQSKEDKKDKDQKQREYDSLAWRSGDGDADQDDARSYTDSFVSDNEEDESVRSGSRARSRSRSRSRTPSRSRRSSRASRSRSGSRASRSRSRSRAGSRTSKHNSDDEDVAKLDRASNYSYSEDFEPSPTHSRTSLQKRGDKAATKDPDTVSVQTYSQCDSMTWKSGGRFRAKGADDSDNESILSREAY